MEFAIWPQDLLTEWVIGCLLVGVVLLVGGARAAGAALVGSSFCSFLAYPLKGLYGGDHLETLVHGAVILGSVGLVGFGLAGLALGTHGPLGRYPMALVLAIGTVVGRDAAGPRDPRGGGSALFAAVVLPGVRGALGPGAACVQRRLPRGAVPGAGLAGVAVIGGGTTPSWTGSSLPVVAGRRSYLHARTFSAIPKGDGAPSSPRWPSLPLVVAMFRKMLEDDRRRAGWSMGQAAWRLGVSVREYREIEAGRPVAGLGDVGSDQQDCSGGRGPS